MSANIPEWYVQSYGQNVYTLAQQKGSRLLKAVDAEVMSGKKKAFDRIGPATAVLATSRHDDTPQIDSDHSKRWVTVAKYHWGDMIDELDKVKLLNDPTSHYVQAGMSALGRSMDDVIITAFTANAVTGEDGDGSASFDTTNNDIVHGSAALTLTKLIQTKEILMGNDYDPDVPMYFCCTAKQIGDLLGDSTITSADYANVKALVNGDINTFMGFEFIRSERLPRTGAGYRYNFAWVKPAMKFGMWQNPIARVSERDDKQYNIQVYVAEQIGAVRMEEKGVVRIDSTE